MGIYSVSGHSVRALDPHIDGDLLLVLSLKHESLYSQIMKLIRRVKENRAPHYAERRKEVRMTSVCNGLLVGVGAGRSVPTNLGKSCLREIINMAANILFHLINLFFLLSQILRIPKIKPSERGLLHLHPILQNVARPPTACRNTLRRFAQRHVTSPRREPSWPCFYFVYFFIYLFQIETDTTGYASRIPIPTMSNLLVVTSTPNSVFHTRLAARSVTSRTQNR